MEPFFQTEFNAELRTATLFLAKPQRRNLLDWSFWDSLDGEIAKLEANKDVKVIVIAAQGTDFTLGLDFKSFFTVLGPLLQEKHAGTREDIRQLVLKMQAGFRRIAQGSKIYIAAVHGHCIGAGLDLISVCDLRLASSDANVSLRETKVAIVADLGSLQFLPRVIGPSNTRMMAYTGRDYSAAECQQMGLFNEVHPSPEATLQAAQALATEIAAQSGITLRGVKHVLNFSERHSPESGMDYVSTWNAAFLESLDLAEALAAFFEKRQPRFQ